MPELDEPACGAGAASWAGFLETVEEDMMVVGIGLEIRGTRFEIRETRSEIDSQQIAIKRAIREALDFAKCYGMKD
jgi:hypothetical protein